MGYVVPQLASHPSCPETHHFPSLVHNSHPACVEDRPIPCRYRDLSHRQPPLSTLPAQSAPSPLRSLPRFPSCPLFGRPFQQPFTKTFFVRSMHLLLLNAGIPTFGYSGHSLRKGAAVTADRNGISRHHIKLLWRWKSDAVDIYINERRKSERMHRLLFLNSQLLSPIIH